MECNPDDISNGRSRAVTLGVGVSLTSGLNSDCGDTDFFRLDVEEGRRYQLSWSTQRSSTKARILDSRNWNYWDYTDDGPAGVQLNPTGIYQTRTSYSFVARTDDEYYFVIEDSFDTSYKVQMHEVVSFGYLHKGVDSIQSFGADPVFGNDGQKRVFTFGAREGERYSLEIIGSDGVDPWIGTRSGETNYYSTGSGNRAKFEFTAEGGQGGGLYYATVGAANPGEFTIRLSGVGDDHPVGTSTNSRINAGKPVVGNAETSDDIDWFRAALTEGEFYKVELKRHENADSLATPLLIVRNPESEMVETSFLPPPLSSSSDGSSNIGEGPEVLFQAESTGDHFFIARSKTADNSGIYQLSYDRVRAPITRKFQSEEFEELSINRFEFTHSLSARLPEFFSAPPQATQIQVYSSTVEIKHSNTVQPLGAVHSFPPSELENWYARTAEFGTHEIMIRAQTGGKWSEWLKTPILNRSLPHSLVSGSLWLEPEIKFHFSDSVPSYFGSNRYDGFQPIDVSNQQNNLGSSLVSKTWNFSGAGPRLGDEDAQIQVFIADNVEGYYEAFAPGDRHGGDIILSSEFYSADEPLLRGTREYAEALRAMGVAVGLKADPDTSRFRSVMGGDMSTGPYPSEFMPRDDDTLREIYDTAFQTPFPQDLDNEAESGYFSQTRVAANDTSGRGIGDSQATESQQVDLRLGNQSFLRTSPPEDRIIEITGDENAVFGYGGQGNDVILGNGRHNSLNGSMGSDYLQGFSGNDSLAGGNGDDWYGYRFGDGNDKIEEGPSTSEGNWPGHDTLRLQGFGPFDLGELQDSVEFERMGLDLHVNLALDQGLPDGQVKIEKQAWGSFQVETIELFQNGVRSSPRISLMSVFSQLSDGETKRFALTDAEDQFGMLVTPV